MVAFLFIYVIIVYKLEGLFMDKNDAEKLDKQGKSIVYSKNLSEDQLSSLSQEFQLQEVEETAIFSVLSDDAKKFLLKLEPASGVISNSIKLIADGKAPQGMLDLENPKLVELANKYKAERKTDEVDYDLLLDLADEYVDYLYPDSDE